MIYEHNLWIIVIRTALFKECTTKLTLAPQPGDYVPQFYDFGTFLVTSTVTVRIKARERARARVSDISAQF